MTQNRSTAVMQRRHEAHDSLDDFPTPPWATRALCEWLAGQGWNLFHLSVREPAANRGFMARPLGEAFGTVMASDVHDYGVGFPQEDYLFPGADRSADWTITNPPFRLAEDFIRAAIEASLSGVAMIVRGAFLEGVGRYQKLFSLTPPTDVLQFCERVPMVKGKYDPLATTATSYAWFVWQFDRPQGETRLHWIPQCRKRLERPDDALWESGGLG
ncbi:hypothetical protein SAMN04490244_101286 [Tranquillimonas rosea]|uniref:Methyltransferase n=1 Tax=Tranquillimonas rosea TaxID=641238 RepID=A0A1H9PQK6_9RHOB|nr:hypothetical protein [Tranquillimonas rosea]SER50370.1 hypothetical protein SAMN04490244_101286 [Tranquillimonas rosea]